MQIHELNSYSGELNSDAFLAVDNGADTGKLSVVALLNDVNAAITETDARIDNIITSPAPTEQEIIDARVGANGVTYPTLASAIQIADEDLSVFGAINRCPVNAGANTSGGITFTGDGKGGYTINGTSTGNVHFSMFNQANAFPPGISANEPLRMYIDNGNPNIRFYINPYINGVKDSAINNIFIVDGYSDYSFPENTTGCEIRLSVWGTGSVASSDFVIPYIFVDKTKHEEEEENTLLTAQMANVLDNLPYGYIPKSLTPTEGLVNKYNDVATPSGYAYVTTPIGDEKKYKISGTYFGGNFPAYLFLTNGAVQSFVNLDTTGDFQDLEIVAPDAATDLIVNGRTSSPAAINEYGILKIGATMSDSVLVGPNSNYLFTDINAAIQANPASIISVDYGTYETEIEGLTTDKRIVGKGKELCILTGTGKDYDTPPIEIAGGIVKGFTVNMQNDEDAAHKGYCLHSDNTACQNNELKVIDCNFSCSGGQHTIGVGIYPGETLVFENCCFDELDEGSNHAAFYGHNSGSSDGVATVKFHNCYFKGYNRCLKLQGWAGNSNVEFEFIGCTCVSETYGTTEECVWTDYVSGDTHDTNRMHEFSGKFSLLPTSHGNNIDVLNA